MSEKAKFILKFLFVLSAIFICTHLKTIPAFSAHLPIPTQAQQIFHGSVPAPPGDTGQEIVQKMVFSGLRYVKIIVAVIGILYITLIGVKLITKGGSEEEITKAKSALVYAIIAFMMISMAEEFGKMFDMRESTILGSPRDILSRVRLFDRQVELFVLFVKYVIGALATLMIVVNGIKLVTSGGNEEDTSQNKKNIMYSGAGLLLIYVGDVFINRVFYRVDKSVYSGITGVHPQVDARAGVEQIVGITNFVVGLVGPVAVLVLLIGAIMYITSRGEEEQMGKAKRLIMAAVVGIILIFGAFAIVNVVLSGRLEGMGAIT